MNSLLPCLNRLSLVAALAITAGFLSCCEKDPEPLYDNGMITGKVNIDNPGGDLYGNNVRIIAHGPYGSKSTLSDYEGNYELSGLGNGTYEIEFNKEGYGILCRPGTQIFGNDTLTMDVFLYKKVNYKMPRLSALTPYSAFGEWLVAIATDIPPGNDEEIQIRVFLSDTKAVSYKNYKYTEIPNTDYIDNAPETIIVRADPEIYSDVPIFKHGQPRYMIAYVCNVDDPGYFNKYYGLRIFSTVDVQQHSRVFEIKFPDL